MAAVETSQPPPAPADPPKEPAFPLPRILTLPSSTVPELITQGAEGRLYKSTYLLPTLPCALKHRPSKPWRHPVLDARLTRHRILSEARILIKCRREGVPVPAVYAVEISDELAASAIATGKSAPAAAAITIIPTQPAPQAQPGAHATGGGCLTLEWIEGEPVRKPINEFLKRRRDAERKAGRAGDAPVTGDLPEDADLVDVMRRIGSAVGRLHRVGVIHGDLTTSNMMLRHSRNTSTTSSNSNNNKRKHGDDTSADSAPTTTNTAAGAGPEDSATSILDGEIVIIDFGLATQGSADEDRAVDLYVLERAFASTHPRAEGLFRVVLEAYGKEFKGAGVVLKKLEDVRMRGRKRSMIG
ncbi:kinase-like domain-containing protein [Microdochium trichocladiopsis]|uniref:EKC/KEOPS complex subunit BUD32 n=1 Tax=Microdochium trichocladiopsis TaxID=1682393 RepID=A0A9P8XYC8_9PEZI|nr:kinase-like domain-containing protein [Microdochium trichocladiopsis]KAH7025935.1 kinase-like domain-containing protein [Microdochium trichocladiopsis]